MSAHLTADPPKDLTRIDVDAPFEVHWWSVKLQVTPEEIHAAVQAVGPSADDVQTALRKAAKTAFRGGGED